MLAEKFAVTLPGAIMPLRIALVFGYGQEADGQIDAQTRDRCMKAVELYKHHEIDAIYLTVSAKKNNVRMADAMRIFLVEQGVKSFAIVTDPRGGNTAGEMDIFLNRLFHGHRDVIFVSTWYHIPRIIWLATWRLPWEKFSVAIAWRHAHFKGDFLKEFLKLGKAVLRPRSSAKVRR